MGKIMKECLYIDDQGGCNLLGDACHLHPICVPIKPIPGKDELVEPKSPLRNNYLNDYEYMKVRKKYKTDRTRYLKALKKAESGSILVDHSIEQFKTNLRYRIKKDSEWCQDQEIANPQATLTTFLLCRWVNCNKGRVQGEICCKEHLKIKIDLQQKIKRKGDKS